MADGPLVLQLLPVRINSLCEFKAAAHLTAGCYTSGPSLQAEDFGLTAQGVSCPSGVPRFPVPRRQQRGEVLAAPALPPGW